MPSDEIYRRFLAASAFGYALTALRAVFDRRRFEGGLAWFDRSEDLDEGFWPSLGAGYLATIAAVAWMASRDRARAAQMAKPLLAAKAATTTLFAYRYARTRRASYAVSALTDGSLLAAMAWLSSRTTGRHLRVVEGNVSEFGG